MTTCWDCSGTRAVPDDLAEGGYASCSSCVVESDDGQTWVVFESESLA